MLFRASVAGVMRSGRRSNPRGAEAPAPVPASAASCRCARSRVAAGSRRGDVRRFRRQVRGWHLVYPAIAAVHPHRRLLGATGADDVLPPGGACRVRPGIARGHPAWAIESNADPSDRNRDGISGRANYMEDLVSGQSRAIGRFGWKANTPNLVQQAAAAYNGDMGITSTLFPGESCEEYRYGMCGTSDRGVRLHRGRGRLLHPVAGCPGPSRPRSACRHPG